MRGSRSRYWLFQAMGWGVFILFNTFFALFFNKLTIPIVERIFLYALLGLFFTHLQLLAFRKIGVLNMPLRNQIIVFGILSILLSLFIGFSETALFGLLRIHIRVENRLPFVNKVMVSAFYSFIFIFFWDLIYFMYHYIRKTRVQEMEALKLEALSRELELKALKSYLNPEFIFNSLAGIQALVDKNPSQARLGVTALSNILRSSIRNEKTEHILFAEEVDLVRNYLELEQIRFGGILNISFDVQEETLDLEVPPMLLQILVENAIKMAVSKQSNGINICIIAQLNKDQLVLRVQNTGMLDCSGGEKLESPSINIKFPTLFGERPKLEVQQLKEDIMEVKVRFPLN